MSVVGITTKGNAEQAELMRLIMDNQHPIVICEGAAGTGKNFISIASALELVLKRRYEKIYYCKNTVDVGRDIGFLPGDIGDKINPYQMALFDTLQAIEKKGKTIKANDAKQKIEVLPLFNVRGRSLENCILIVDEAQNLDLVSLRTLCTRLGDYCKLVFLGSYKQIDDPKQRKQEKCDFQKMAEAFEDLAFVGQVTLVKSMRSEYCAILDEIFEGIK